MALLRPGPVELQGVGLEAGLRAVWAVPSHATPAGCDAASSRPSMHPWPRTSRTTPSPRRAATSPSAACDLLGLPPGSLRIRKAGVVQLRFGPGGWTLEGLLRPKLLLGSLGI